MEAGDRAVLLRVSETAGASAVNSDADLRREIRSYRKLCREIDRLLAAGELSEARQLNDEARALFRRLYGYRRPLTGSARRQPRVVLRPEP